MYVCVFVDALCLCQQMPPQDQFDTIDFSNNEIRKLDGFPHLKRLKSILMNNNRVWLVDMVLEVCLAFLDLGFHCREASAVAYRAKECCSVHMSLLIVCKILLLNYLLNFSHVLF